ncbi:hemK methyltransferase family member 1-like isoform X2 [Acanthaster planci]|uniref:HemK methyltransferase family member 1-like isoform X2 n=1 Tax=Acanthaster planci TaxID=133434 RepID=A0A8B7ZWW9_ACAPL|nr:hemK methyltransferase family member 1-like isoform X2 [Acanthaster planci]
MIGPLKLFTLNSVISNCKRTIVYIDSLPVTRCSKRLHFNIKGCWRWMHGISCQGNDSSTEILHSKVRLPLYSQNKIYELKKIHQNVKRYIRTPTCITQTFSTSVTLQNDEEECSTQSSKIPGTNPEQGGPTLSECCSPQAAVCWWSASFSEGGVPEAEISAKFIVAHALGYKQLHELTSSRLAKPLTQAELDLINRLCTKRMQRIPVQYIVGDWDFHDLTLLVRPPVFIPRPETEMLVDIILGHYSEEEELHFLEIGCGCGAITLSLLFELPLAHVTAVDCSEEAVLLMLENAKRYEDFRALCGGADGMALIKDILWNSHLLLKTGGFIWLETDSRHPEAIKAWLDSNLGTGVEFLRTFQDYHYRPRFSQLRYGPC